MPGKFQEAMKLPDEQRWRAAAKKEMDSLEDLQVYKLFLLALVYTNRGGILKSRLTTLTSRAWWLEAGAKSLEKQAATSTLRVADFRVFEWFWLSPQRLAGRWYS